MRKFVVAVGALALVACSQSETPIAEEEVTEPVQAPLAVDGGPLAGSYTAVDADGIEAVWTLNDDGTFALAAEGVDPVSGTFTQDDSEGGTKFCADPEGDELGQTCWTLGTLEEDGSWSATGEDGAVLTITRAEAEAEAEL